MILVVLAFFLGAYLYSPTVFEKPIVELGETYPAGSKFEVQSIAWSRGYNACFHVVTRLPDWLDWSTGWCNIFPVYFAQSQYEDR